MTSQSLLLSMAISWKMPYLRPSHELSNVLYWDNFFVGSVKWQRWTMRDWQESEHS